MVGDAQQQGALVGEEIAISPGLQLGGVVDVEAVVLGEGRGIDRFDDFVEEAANDGVESLEAMVVVGIPGDVELGAEGVAEAEGEQVGDSAESDCPGAQGRAQGHAQQQPAHVEVALGAPVVGHQRLDLGDQCGGVQVGQECLDVLVQNGLATGAEFLDACVAFEAAGHHSSFSAAAACSVVRLRT